MEVCGSNPHATGLSMELIDHPVPEDVLQNPEHNWAIDGGGRPPHAPRPAAATCIQQGCLSKSLTHWCAKKCHNQTDGPPHADAVVQPTAGKELSNRTDKPSYARRRAALMCTPWGHPRSSRPPCAQSHAATPPTQQGHQTKRLTTPCTKTCCSNLCIIGQLTEQREQPVRKGVMHKWVMHKQKSDQINSMPSKAKLINALEFSVQQSSKMLCCEHLEKNRGFSSW